MRQKSSSYYCQVEPDDQNQYPPSGCRHQNPFHPQKCLTCYKNYSENYGCVVNCRQYYNDIRRSGNLRIKLRLQYCQSCMEGCKVCNISNEFCNVCKKGYFKTQDFQCLKECQGNAYFMNENSQYNKMIFPKYSDYQNDQIIRCLKCHTGCKTCTGEKKQDCIEFYCQKTTLNNTYFILILLIFLIAAPLFVILQWRKIKSKHIRNWKKKIQSIANEEQRGLCQGSLDLHVFYYYSFAVKKTKCNDYLLCILATSDLTFTALNPDMYQLREITALMNATRSVIYFALNLLIYNDYSEQISILNILVSALLLPLPFIYKLFISKKQSKKSLSSEGLDKFYNLQENYRNIHTHIRKKSVKPFFIIVFGFLTIALLLIILMFEQPDIKWFLVVILIQYISYLIFYLLWGLICYMYLIKRKNSFESISKVPDWRVQMVFQDLLIMSQNLNKNKDQDNVAHQIDANQRQANNLY